MYFANFRLISWQSNYQKELLNMGFSRRGFIQKASIRAGASLILGSQSCTKAEQENTWKTTLTSKTKDFVYILPAEWASRIEKAQKLMAENNLEAIILDAGSTMNYFTGITWWQSERSMLVIIPQKGEIAIICPAFEENRLKEMAGEKANINIWQEDESPFLKTANALAKMGILNGTVGIEEQLRFFIFDGIRKVCPKLKFISADGVTIPCRIIKSKTEIALMQRAFDITAEAMKIAFSQLKEGISANEISNIISEASQIMGGESEGALVLFGIASSLPHGTRKPQILKKGDVVLIDCGCKVGGYTSDVTRTIVFGKEPTKRQHQIWDLEQKAQLAGFKAAKIGGECQEVDFAARKVIAEAGFGPEYKLPGLPHRTGHGIGMDGHEWGNIVKGNTQLLQVGMCFSVEPTIAIPGEFGIRLEDCAYMTNQGAKWFLEPAPSINEPFLKIK